jgi:integrase
MKQRKRKDGILELKNGKFQATVWYVDERGNRVKKEKSFISKKAARSWRDSFKTDIIRGAAGITSSQVTVEELFAKASARRESRLRTKWPDDTDQQIRNRLSHDRVTADHFKRVTGPTKKVVRITAADIEKYIDLRRGEKIRPRTINVELILIKNIFKLAPLIFRDLANWRPPSVVLLADSHRGRDRTLSYDEEAKIYTALEGKYQDIADFFLIAIDTAMRAQEILKLTPLNIHFEHVRFGKVGAIEVVATKVDKSKTIPMTPAVRDIMLRRCAQTEPDGFIFPFDNIRRVSAQYRIIRTMQSISKHLSIPYGRFTKGGWIIHDLRRTAINRMLGRTHYDYSTVSRIAGLSIEIMLKFYPRSDDDQMLTAVMRSVEKSVET